MTVGPLGKAHRLFTSADGLHTPWYYGVEDPGAVGAAGVWVVPVPDATTPTSFLFRQRNTANSAWFLLLDTAAIGGAPASHAASHEDGGGDELELAQSQITDLVADLAAKAAAVHTHAQSDITDLVADLAAIVAAIAAKADTSYVDAAVAGLSWKQSVRAATDAAGTLASDFENGDEIDGVTLATNDRILIKDQAAPEENGIYIVAASGAPTRAADANSAAEVLQASVYVQEGTAHADTQWVCTTNAPITLGVTSLAFAQLSTGAADHGALSGLGDDDHPQYLLADGSRALVGDLDADGNTIENLPDPVSDQQAATKKYVDDEIAGVGAGGISLAIGGYNTIGASVETAVANAQNWAIPFTLPVDALIIGIEVYHSAADNNDAGVGTCALYTDNAGAPGTPLDARSGSRWETGFLAEPRWVPCSLLYPVVASTTYWAVTRTTDNGGTTLPAIAYDAGGAGVTWTSVQQRWLRNPSVTPTTRTYSIRVRYIPLS